MQNCAPARVQIRTGKKTGIWPALTVALGLHAIILFLPITRQTPAVDDVRAPIELQLTTFHPQSPATEEPDIPAPIPVPEPITEQAPEPPESIAEAQPDAEPPLLIPDPHVRDLAHDLETMSEQQKSQLTNAILTRQFISEESAADRLFGKPLEQHASELQKEFHYPVRQDMIAMLDQPMPNIPFAYTPGLINFAYDPGVKGNLQRFWDVITPEFGWITNNGTEFKCVWVLVIAACGWK